MPLSKEIVTMLASGNLETPRFSESDYLSIIPTLGSEFFPDQVSIWELSCSGSDAGEKLHRLLKEAGLSKGQRAGMSNLLGNFSRLGGYDLEVGDVRALTIEELSKLQKLFDWRKPTIISIKKIKKLLG